MAAIIEAPPDGATRRRIAAAFRAYERSTAATGPADEWDNRVIDQAIRAMCLQGRPFSVNDFRDLLPPVRKCLISRRLIAAQRAGWVRPVGVTHSTLPSTKAARVSVYQPIPGGTR